MRPLNLNPTMLILGREFRGMNQSDLATKLNVTQGTISKIEMGVIGINEDLLDKLSETLDLPLTFFEREGNTFPPNLYYRKKVKTSRQLQIKDEALMNVHRLNIHRFLKSIDFEHEILPVFDVEVDGSPIVIAKKLRQLWQIPNGPIRNLFQLLESKGIMICPCKFESPGIDGRSMYTDNKDIILFVNSNKPMDRQRYTLAHELFHIIAHVFSYVPDSRDIENEANLFAGEFLIPEDDLRKYLNTPVTLALLADLKKYFRVSMQSILMKISKVKPLTSNQQKYLWASLSNAGFRTQEPPELDPPKEIPILLGKMLKIFREDFNYSEAQMEELLALKTSDIKNLYNSSIGGTKMRIVA